MKTNNLQSYCITIVNDKYKLSTLTPYIIFNTEYLRKKGYFIDNLLTLECTNQSN